MTPVEILTLLIPIGLIQVVLEVSGLGMLGALGVLRPAIESQRARLCLTCGLWSVYFVCAFCLPLIGGAP